MRIGVCNDGINTSFTIGYDVNVFPFWQQPLLYRFELVEISLSLFCLFRLILRYFGYDVTVALFSDLFSLTAFSVNATPSSTVIRLIQDPSNVTPSNQTQSLYIAFVLLHHNLLCTVYEKKLLIS